MRRALFSLLIGITSFARCAQNIEVLPYVQPGDGASLVGTDVKNIIWLTGPTLAEYVVEYGIKGHATRRAKIQRTALDFAQTQMPPRKDPPILEREQHYLRYTAALTDLPFDAEVEYRVSLNGELIRGGTFQTRASFERPIRFIAVGDLAKGNPIQNAVAYQMYQAKPQFLVALGDIVYPTGRVIQYFNHFWKTYNQPTDSGSTTGAPLMASIPFYPVIGNHDLDSKMTLYPDSLGAFHFFSVPLNGPGEGPWNPLIPKECADKFREMAGPNYPAVSYYSFDSGPAHFLILDSNSFDLVRLSSWVEKDLTSTKARWKIVCIHSPAFHSSREHYDAQKMRMLVPLLERCGVDLVLAGHLHNYQRSKPMRFEPDAVRKPGSSLINGKFTLDSNFDGVENTRPDGIIHIVCGGGGASLYKGVLEKNAEMFREKFPENWAPYTVKFESERHSFALIDASTTRLELRAMDGITGVEFDKIIITKPAP